MRANRELREKSKECGVKHWQIAEEIGVSEQTIMRWLRVPLRKDRESIILAAIEKLSKEEC